MFINEFILFIYFIKRIYFLFNFLIYLKVIFLVLYIIFSFWIFYNTCKCEYFIVNIDNIWYIYITVYKILYCKIVHYCILQYMLYRSLKVWTLMMILIRMILSWHTVILFITIAWVNLHNNYYNVYIIEITHPGFVLDGLCETKLFNSVKELNWTLGSEQRHFDAGLFYYSKGKYNMCIFIYSDRDPDVFLSYLSCGANWNACICRILCLHMNTEAKRNLHLRSVFQTHRWFILFLSGALRGKVKSYG